MGPGDRECSAVFFERPGGAGPEGRFVRHSAVSVDLRASGRNSPSSDPDHYRTDAQSSLLPYLGKQIGILVRAGFAVYLWQWSIRLEVHVASP